MGAFAYEARTESGELVTGVINAATMDEAGRLLGEKDVYVVRLGPTAMRGKSGAGGKSDRRRAKLQSVTWFTSQLAIMVETGTNISESLDCLARQTKEPVFHSVLEEVAQHVREGKPLSDAISNYPRAFPKIVPALVRAGESSGTMSQILGRVSAYLQYNAAILKKLRGALIYPIFMLVMSLGVAVFMLTVILPKFEELFAAKGATLPLPTRILMAASDLLIEGYMIWISAVVAIFVGGWYWLHTPTGRRNLDWLKLHVPVFSGIFRKLYLSQAFRTLGTLLQAGVPLSDSIEIAGEIANNYYINKMWTDVRTNVTRGEALSGPLMNSPYVEESFGQMIASGDKVGRLGMVFERLADFCEEEFDQTVKSAMQFIEPVMILFIGSMIGFVAISLLMPMFQVGKAVGH